MVERDHPSPKTVANHLTLLISLLRLAHELGWLAATAVLTGLRAGELAALRWEDVDLDAWRINVQRSFDAYTRSPAPLALGKIKPRIETYPLAKVNEVRERLEAGKVRYRAVLQHAA